MTTAGDDHRLPGPGADASGGHRRRPRRQPLVHRELLATRSAGSRRPGRHRVRPLAEPGRGPDGAPRPDGNLWFTERRQQDRPHHDRGVDHRVPRPIADSGAYGITVGPDGNLWFTEFGDGHGRAVASLGGGAVTEIDGELRSACPRRRRRDRRRGPDGNSGSPSCRRASGAITPAGDVTAFRSRTRRGQRRRASPPGPTATSGSPRAGRTRSAGSRPRASSPSSPSHGRQPALRHHRRPRRQPLVHREQRQQDRPHHHRGRHHRVSHPDRRAPDRTGITAGPDGNLWFTERGEQPDRPDHDRRVDHASSRSRPPTADPEDITAGPDGNLWFTENSGNKIGRITHRRRHHRVPAGRAPAARPAASPPDPTATSGSPSSTATRSAGSRPPGSSPSSSIPIGRQRRRRHHGRPRRQPLVHRVQEGQARLGRSRRSDVGLVRSDSDLGPGRRRDIGSR